MNRILLVEDDRNTREGLAELLRHEGYVVFALDKGENAVHVAKTQACTIVLCDYKLPDMNGISVCRAIRKEDPSMTILMFTAFAVPGLKEAAEEIGVKKVYSKPLDLNAVFDDLALSVQNRPNNTLRPFSHSSLKAL